MIQIIAGKKGSGKTKRLIDLTNATAKEATHSIIFVDDDNSYMYDIDHSVRFVNAADFYVENADMFLGFLGGMLASNFDIGTIFVDAFKKIAKADLADCGTIIKAMEELGSKHDVNFVLSVSEDPAALPDFMKPYVI